MQAITFVIVLGLAAILLLFLVEIKSEDDSLYISASKSCPPGYVIDENGYCDPKLSSEVPVPAPEPAPEPEQQELYFSTSLSGDAEVPPVTSSASGVAAFSLNEDGNEMSYELEVENIESILFAHIHNANEFGNGPIVVTLFNATDGPTNEIDGTLESGTFTAEDLEGSLEGQTMADLVDAIQSGQAYVNVHTEANPPGEIRGTIKEE